MRFLLAFIFLISNTTWAQTVGKDIEANSSTGLDYFTNYVRSPSAKKNAASVTTSSATVTKDTTNKIDNVASYSVDTSALNGYVEFILNTVYAPATGGNCEFKGVFLGDGSLYRAQIVDGSGNLLNQTSVLSPSDATKWQPFSVTYPCAASGSRKVRITQTEAGTSPAINVGKLYYGSATGIGTGSLQPQYVGSLKYAATANCEWSTTSTSFANFAADTDCATPTVSGGISAPATKIPGFVINNIKPGTYLFIGRGVFRETGGNNTHHGFRFNDGTNSTVQNPLYVSNAGGLLFGSINGEITYTRAQSNVTVQVQALISGTDSAQITANGNNYDLEFSVYYFPPAGIQSTITPDQWNYPRTAYTPTFTGFGTVTNIECYHWREDEYLGIDCKFTPGTTTATEARMTLPNNLVAQTWSQGIKVAGVYTQTIASTAHGGWALMQSATGYLTFSPNAIFGSTSQSPLSNSLGSSSFGSGDANHVVARIPIQGWTTSQKAPQLIGSVTSNANGALLFEFADFTGTFCTSLTRQTGSSFSAGTSPATGRCTIPMSGFSAVPYCTCSAKTATGGALGGHICEIGTGTTSSSLELATTSTGGALTNYGFTVMCMGHR